MTHEINGVQLDIDMGDVAFIERYEKAFERMEENEAKVPKTGTTTERAKAFVSIFYELFDDIFGKGTGDKVFGGKLNISLCLDAYDELLTACKGQVDAANKSMAKKYSKYMPKNRK